MTNAYPIAEMVESALRALADDLPGSTDIEQVELVLEQAGDALRAGVPIPRSIASWMERLASDSLAEVIAHWISRLSSTPLPGSEAELVGGAATLRDRSESIVVAVRRACVGADRAPGDVPGLEALLETQERFDAQLARHVSRTALEDALGIRRGLLASGSWTDRMPEHESRGESGEPPVVSGSAPTTAAPSDAIVTAYIHHGATASWVESYAARSPDFAEELATTISWLRSVGEEVGLAARRWEAHHARSGSVRMGLAMKQAAADAEVSSRVELQLGVLAPTDAQARMIVEAGYVTVRVLPYQDTLRSVRFGEAHLDTESAPGAWELTQAWTTEPIVFSVETTDGRRFEAELALHAGSDAP